MSIYCCFERFWVLLPLEDGTHASMATHSYISELCGNPPIFKTEPDFHHEITFLTIISLGLHSMNPNLRCPSTTVTAIHIIIGLGIKFLTTYPIESAESLDSTIIRYRLVFKNFISNFICSKIECHIRKHGPNPNLFLAKLDLESALWMLLENPTSVMLPSWSDYTYCDPFNSNPLTNSSQ